MFVHNLSMTSSHEIILVCVHACVCVCVCVLGEGEGFEWKVTEESEHIWCFQAWDGVHE